MFSEACALAEEIKATGRRAISQLPPLLDRATRLATDSRQDALTRGVAYRAAGNAHQLLNNFEGALAHYDFAIPLLETARADEELGRTLLAKVGLLFFMSRFDELFRSAERAEDIFRRLENPRYLARLDVNVAHAYHRLDRHPESLVHSERAMVALEDTGDREGLLGAVINSAVTLTSLSEFEQAEQRFSRALALATELQHEAWAMLSRYNLAYLRFLRGDSGDALDQLMQLRIEYEGLGDERHVCLCWLHEAEILLEIGEFEECILAARQARERSERLQISSETGKALLWEAIALIRMGREGAALPLFDLAAHHFTADGNALWSASARLQIALFRGELGDEASLAQAIGARDQIDQFALPGRRALANIVVGRLQRTRGLHAEATLSFENARDLALKAKSEWMHFHASSELGATLARQGDARCRELLLEADSLLDRLWHRLGRDELKTAFLADRENVYTHLIREHAASPEKALEISEKARSRVLREQLHSSGVRWDAHAFQSLIGPTETLVEYFIDGNDLLIFAVNRDGLRMVSQSGVVPQVAETIRSLDRHLSSCAVKWEHLGPVQNRLYATACAHLGSLYDALVRPIADELRTTVVFIPHGLLHVVPFHALYDGASFLAAEHAVAYSPSATLYVSPARPAAGGCPLLVGFSGSRTLNCAEEIEIVRRFVGPADVLINPPIETLRNAMATPRSLVHIAGHAGIDPVRGQISWIETPEGRITARHLIDMKIQTGTLVVTGCRTAQRAIQPGDEWLGLMRAFYLSGAHSIVSIFWEIRDDTALRFANHFYAAFDGENAVQAVQQACSSLRTETTHPYFWAGFGAFARKRLNL